MPAIQRLPFECSTVNKTEKQVGSCSRNSSDMSSSQPQSGNWYPGFQTHTTQDEAITCCGNTVQVL